MSQQSRITSRSRNNNEAADLGAVIFKDKAWRLIALWCCTSLPVFAVLCLAFWHNPFWILFAFWWLKPLFEAGILAVVSDSIFNRHHSFRHDLKLAFKLFLRPRIIGDLTWRRLSPHRSLVLPINTLEHLNGKRYTSRAQEITRHVGGKATSLTLFGSMFESIWTLGIFIGVTWFLMDNPATTLIPHEFKVFADASYVYNILSQFLNQQDMWYKLFSAAYWLVLCFWGPIYVCSGFSLYLHARNLSEAWDLKLAFQNIAKRLSQGLGSFLMAMLLTMSLGIYSPDSLAQRAPNNKELIQQQQKALSEAPFPHVVNGRTIEPKNTKKTNDQPNFKTPDMPNVPFFDLRGFFWILIIGIGIVLLVIFLRKMKDTDFSRLRQEKKAPKTLFGLDMSPEALPKNPSQNARELAKNGQIQAALSVLYRASLVQLLHEKNLPITESDTEGEVLVHVKQHATPQLPYMKSLTQSWQFVTYGHYDLPVATVLDLCDNYHRAFEPTKPTGEPS